MLKQDESTGILKMLPPYWSAGVKLPTDHCNIFLLYYDSYNAKSIVAYRYASRVYFAEHLQFFFCRGIE